MWHHDPRINLYHAVWFYNVQIGFLLRGWLTKQGLLELNEATSAICKGRAAGYPIPSMGEACDWINGG